MNEIRSLRALSAPISLENPETALEAGQHGTVVCGSASSRPFDETVCTKMLAKSWLDRLTARRDRLMADIPARSDDPVHYRSVIYAAAEQVLRDGICGEPSGADSPDAFRAA